MDGCVQQMVGFCVPHRGPGPTRKRVARPTGDREGGAADLNRWPTTVRDASGTAGTAVVDIYRRGLPPAGSGWAVALRDLCPYRVRLISEAGQR